jgi:hypothetical protein
MSHGGIEILGWTATAVFVGSYFCARPSWLRRVQMGGALLWVTYGILIGASPVIVANVLVFSAAAWTALRRPAMDGQAVSAGAKNTSTVSSSSMS